MSFKPPSDRGGFTIAIICVLKPEYDAVALIFDQFWEDDEGRDIFGKADGDDNHYANGRIGNYNVVLARLSCMGKATAAGLAASMRSSYGSLRLALVVGVCGGVPRNKHGKEILLGDVVISDQVVQYDFQRQLPDKFERKTTVKDNLGRPNRDVGNLLITLDTNREIQKLETRTAKHLKHLQEASNDYDHNDTYKYPGTAEDKLYEPTYRHKHQFKAACECGNCNQDEHPVCDLALSSSCIDLGCEDAHIIPRRRLERKQELEKARNEAKQHPSIHIGSIASGDTVMKSALHRDRIVQKEEVIAFEMEGAGVWDEFPCIVVKGVCDYADSHKHKDWQNFASATAAATTKAILERYTQTDKNRSSNSLGTVSVEVSNGPVQHAQPPTNAVVTRHLTQGGDAGSTTNDAKDTNAQSAEEAKALADSASSFRNQGQYNEAYTSCMNSLKIREKLLGDQHEDTIRSRADLAAILHDQKKFKEAKMYGIIAWYERDKVLGAKHSDTLQSRAVLANIESSLGDTKQSLRLREEVFNARCETQGKKHLDTIQSMADLASSYRAEGRYDEAYTYCLSAHDFRKEVLGKADLDTIRYKVDLAVILHDQKKFKEARDCAQSALTEQEEFPGKSHRDTIHTRNALSYILEP